MQSLPCMVHTSADSVSRVAWVLAEAHLAKYYSFSIAGPG